MARREPLRVFIYGHQVATLESPKPWIVKCTYVDEAFKMWEANIPLLSCSLPLRRDKRMEATVFFNGLLPEGSHREGMASRIGVASTDTHALLQRYGKDVAGAISIVSEDKLSAKPDVKPYSATELEDEVRSLPENPLGLHDDSRLSIAGLQNKLLLVRVKDGVWGRPINGLPSTHILKTEAQGFTGLIEAEAACLRMAREIGLTEVDIQVQSFADIPCLVVSRFDRRLTEGGQVERIHQEDACQALAIDSEKNQRRGKYEYFGGPSLRHIAGLLDLYARRSALELDRLIAMITFNVIIGNADAHGKNVALLHPSPEAISLAPAYDTVPTLLWPKLQTQMAMRVGNALMLERVTSSDVIDEAAGWKHDKQRARTVSGDTAEQALNASRTLDLPPQVKALIETRADRFLSGKELGTPN